MKFRYLALGLLITFTLTISYSLISFYSSSSLSSPSYSTWSIFDYFCDKDIGHVPLVHVINNKIGKTHRVVWDVDSPINYAYRKFATLSETLASEALYGGYRVTDGDIGGLTMAHSTNHKGAYLDLDLSEKIPIKCVRLFNRNEKEYQERIIPFKIFLSNIPFPAKVQIEESGKVALTFIEFNEGQLIYLWKLPETVHAQFLRIQLANEQTLNLLEVEVYDTYVDEDFRFVPRFIQERIPDPLVHLPHSFSTFLSAAGTVLNMSSPLRVFGSYGKEFTSTSSIKSHKPKDLFISQSEDFIGDVKACIVFLCTQDKDNTVGVDYMTIILLNLELLSANLFLLRQYTVIIFHVWDPWLVPINKKKFETSFPHLNFKFVDVTEHFPTTLPKHLIENKVDMSLYEQGTDCAPGNKWSLNYLHMGRFWSTQLWKYPILKEYDYIIKLDADTTIDKPVNPQSPDFIRDMKEKKKIFGYWCKSKDPPTCASGISKATETFATKKGLKYRHKDKVSDDTTYWGGFGVYATQFFCHNKDWLEYIDYLDSIGGHYNHRWAEQNILPRALSLFAEFNEVYWINGTKYLNVFHDHKLMENWHGVTNHDIKYIT